MGVLPHSSRRLSLHRLPASSKKPARQKALDCHSTKERPTNIPRGFIDCQLPQGRRGYVFLLSHRITEHHTLPRFLLDILLKAQRTQRRCYMGKRKMLVLRGGERKLEPTRSFVTHNHFSCHCHRELSQVHASTEEIRKRVPPKAHVWGTQDSQPSAVLGAEVLQKARVPGS
jgi:hypothetical protein